VAAAAVAAAAEVGRDDRVDWRKIMGAVNIITLALTAGIGIWIILTYNRFVTLRNRCVNALSQIDIQIEKRHALVPRLVDTVKGYAAHERETLEKVTEARTKAVEATSYSEKASAEEGLDSAVRTVFAVAEAYPRLRADSLFLELQRGLTQLEDDIRFSRQFYNDSVMIHNTTISTFPNNLVARLTGAGELEYFGLTG
jgi:LemA protein